MLNIDLLIYSSQYAKTGRKATASTDKKLFGFAKIYRKLSHL